MNNDLQTMLAAFIIVCIVAAFVWMIFDTDRILTELKNNDYENTAINKKIEQVYYSSLIPERKIIKLKAIKEVVINNTQYLSEFEKDKFSEKIDKIIKEIQGDYNGQV